MGISAIHLKKYVIEPTLDSIGLLSDSAVNLLLGTCAQESLMGKHLHQTGGGPAQGIYQMEPETHEDIWENYLYYREELAELIVGSARQSIQLFVLNEEYNKPKGRLITDLRYATAMARVRYFVYRKRFRLLMTLRHWHIIGKIITTHIRAKAQLMNLSNIIKCLYWRNNMFKFFMTLASIFLSIALRFNKNKKITVDYILEYKQQGINLYITVLALLVIAIGIGFLASLTV